MPTSARSAVGSLSVKHTPGAKHRETVLKEMNRKSPTPTFKRVNGSRSVPSKYSTPKKDTSTANVMETTGKDSKATQATTQKPPTTSSIVQTKEKALKSATSSLSVNSDAVKTRIRKTSLKPDLGETTVGRSRMLSILATDYKTSKAADKTLGMRSARGYQRYLDISPKLTTKLSGLVGAVAPASTLQTASYWLAHIKIAEAESKHDISICFFRLALNSAAQPHSELLTALKLYLKKYPQILDSYRDTLSLYDILGETTSSTSNLPRLAKGEAGSDGTEFNSPSKVVLSMQDASLNALGDASLSETMYEIPNQMAKVLAHNTNDAEGYGSQGKCALESPLALSSDCCESGVASETCEPIVSETTLAAAQLEDASDSGQGESKNGQHISPMGTLGLACADGFDSNLNSENIHTIQGSMIPGLSFEQDSALEMSHVSDQQRTVPEEAAPLPTSSDTVPDSSNSGVPSATAVKSFGGMKGKGNNALQRATTCQTSLLPKSKESTPQAQLPGLLSTRAVKGFGGRKGKGGSPLQQTTVSRTPFRSQSKESTSQLPLPVSAVRQVHDSAAVPELNVDIVTEILSASVTGTGDLTQKEIKSMHLEGDKLGNQHDISVSAQPLKVGCDESQAANQAVLHYGQKFVTLRDNPEAEAEEDVTDDLSMAAKCQSLSVSESNLYPNLSDPNRIKQNGLRESAIWPEVISLKKNTPDVSLVITGTDEKTKEGIINIVGKKEQKKQVKRYAEGDTGDLTTSCDSSQVFQTRLTTPNTKDAKSRKGVHFNDIPVILRTPSPCADHVSGRSALKATPNLVTSQNRKGSRGRRSRGTPYKQVLESSTCLEAKESEAGGCLVEHVAIQGSCDKLVSPKLMEVDINSLRIQSPASPKQPGQAQVYTQDTKRDPTKLAETLSMCRTEGSEGTQIIISTKADSIGKDKSSSLIPCQGAATHSEHLETGQTADMPDTIPRSKKKDQQGRTSSNKVKQAGVVADDPAFATGSIFTSAPETPGSVRRSARLRKIVDSENCQIPAATPTTLGSARTRRSARLKTVQDPMSEELKSIPMQPILD